jgi:hypothetical protein
MKTFTELTGTTTTQLQTIPPYINNNYDFQRYQRDLGELNASHTGELLELRSTSDRTASLGLFYDYSSR